VFDAFAYATEAISHLSQEGEISFSCYAPQGPLLEANGNRVANEEPADNQVARGRTIGIGQLFADGTPPRIGSVSMEEGGEGVVISAEDITSTEDILKVWAVIKPISFCGNIPVYSGEETIELEEVELKDLDGDGRYEGTYPDPVDTFRIHVYARDNRNTVSSPKETKIYRTEGWWDIYEPDDMRQQANNILINYPIPQPHNFHAPNDWDWVVFYGIAKRIDPETGEAMDEKYTYRIRAGNLDENCYPVIALYYEDDDEPLDWTYLKVDNTVELELELPRDGFYYVWLLHWDTGEWGGNKDYDLRVYNQDLGLPERVYGRVDDQVFGEPIHGAKITTESGGTISTHGEYHFMQIPGRWNMNASCPGIYHPYHTTIEVTAGHPVRKDINMHPLANSTTTSVSSSGCTTDAFCSDGRFCNGIERCVAGYCLAGERPCADDELFCNGEEWCDEQGDRCVHSGDPCAPDLICDEGRNLCVGCTDDGDCRDELFCNGEETCVAGVCQPGEYPCREGEECDEENDVCYPEPVPDTTTILATTTTVSSGLCITEELYGRHSKEVELLRSFRDNLLNQTPEGREIIRLYYRWSPVIVKMMEEDEKFRKEVKEMVDGMLPLIESQVE
jgi:hypothetical protein